MKQISYKIPGIHCGHCVMRIKNSLLSLDGVESVEGNPAEKEVEVALSVPADDAQIRSKLAEIGYPAEEAH
ncbi:MAG: heavy-metal-associated domain-containing protein [Anaerolineaceae bacterium]|nr:heavy-metal-associated domain-containing protein [Anaerolineaceae bacterium]